jgi:hypothetical protein
MVARNFLLVCIDLIFGCAAPDEQHERRNPWPLKNLLPTQPYMYGQTIPSSTLGETSETQLYALFRWSASEHVGGFGCRECVSARCEGEEVIKSRRARGLGRNVGRVSEEKEESTE